MPVMYCSECGKQCPDSFHPIADPCRCVDWVQRYKRKGWTMHPETLKAFSK